MRCEPRVLESRFSVTQRLAVLQPHDAPARRGQHRVARCDIPFHGSPEARVEICATLGEHAEFERRACLDSRGHRATLQPSIERRAVTMRSAFHHGQALGGNGSTGNGPPFSLLLFERAERSGSGIERIEGGREDDSEHRLSRANESDIHREFAIATDEFPGAIKRIDEPERTVRRVDRRDTPCGDRFLGDDREAGGEALESRQDDGFRALVGDRYRRRVGLLGDRERGAVDLGNDLPGIAGDADDRIQKPGIGSLSVDVLD